MAFRFPLEAVYKFRRSVERQQELRLRAANQAVARVRREIDRTNRRMQELRTAQLRELDAGTTAAELCFALLCEATLRREYQENASELGCMQALRDRQQEIFQDLRRERESLESLRQDQQWEYNRQNARRQQRQLDDLFLLRQTYLRRGLPLRAS